jgi:hypothetical protein
VKRLPAAPVAPRVLEVVTLALALVVADELFEELPHAASARLASRSRSAAAAADLRLLLMI